MTTTVTSSPSSPRRTPWNKGKLIGAKPPLRIKNVWAIRSTLQLSGRIRDLALFNRKRASHPTLTAGYADFAAYAHGINSSMRDAGHRLTSLVSTSVVQAKGSTRFSLQVSNSERKRSPDPLLPNLS